ncbi:hypothetical protein HCN44_008733 [Aphidius gifuensis]|uniref:BRCT domain-containing protein n=1 Tax=Aphidius gifuensis TaxID=684658 RepID=A0A834Y1G3_APHGI|nr:DNA topoisomerase 2-binding protein 1-B isoform X2 [Aphidius gifuensis]KAF7995978.1 hypothetical protein HCN44_008733 [Aphidius gifuensis]
MASQFNESQESLNIYFVILAKHGDKDNCSENMCEAYEKCVANELSPAWIHEDDCTKLTPKKTDIFVFQEFDGNLFNKLKTTKCFRIIGPKCLLHCFLTNSPVPKGTSPVFTTAMENMVIAVSGFTPEKKEKIQQKVEYMGGIYMKQLRSCVTHLITDSVSSAKYEKASEKGIEIFSESWINAVWEKNQNEFIKASDPIFNNHKSPVFMNLVVTSTGLSKRQKEEVKKLINENGGEFSGPLDGTRVKIVLAKEYSTISEKIKYAMHNSIPCLRYEWVKKSLQANYALPYSSFIISPGENKSKSSTPEKNLSCPSLNFSTISCISKDAQNVNFIEETLTSTINSISPATVGATVFTAPIQKKLSTQTCQNKFDINKIDMYQVKNAGPFLDGCNIYLAGFSTISKDKVNKILNLGSATRFDDISDALTHVIVEDSIKAIQDLKSIESKNLNPYILHLDWLEASLKQKKPALEDNYLFSNKDVNKVAPPSPLSKKNLQMLITENNGQQSPSPPNLNDTSTKKNTNHDDDDDDDDNSIMKQYRQPTVTERTLDHLLQSKNTSPSKPNNNKSQNSANLDGQDMSEIPFSQTSDSERIFEGITFLTVGLESEENESIIANISSLGGKIVATNFSGVPDYGVVPLEGVILKHAVNEIVTNLWVHDCIDNESLVSIEYYHKPLSINRNIKPLKDCVIAISSYGGKEREYLSELAVALGATHQETFARKTNPEKGLFGGTHLICTSPEGNKYSAAVKWNLPAVNKDWLIACAERQQLVDEKSFLIGETIAPERQNQDNLLVKQIVPSLTPSFTNRVVITPKRNLQVNSPCSVKSLETPIVDKRLSLAQDGSQSSPFNFATPETPYGQVFKENPSPETRKVCAKWIEGFPDKTEEPPKKKKRIIDTPLTELKRKIWSGMKKPITESDEKNLNSSILNIQQFDNENNYSDYSKRLQHDEKDSVTENKNPELSLPINRQLSFNEDTSKENDIQQQLDEMNKLLRANSNSSTESRFSIHDGNGKIYEPKHRENNIQATLPESVGWEDPHPVLLKSTPSSDDATTEITDTNLIPRKKIVKFMLSGIKDRSGYEQVIENLGGQVSTDSNFDITATHLICVRPARNEKMLASIAAGKWILHCSYLRDSETAGKFLDENDYEWGNPKMTAVGTKLINDIEHTLASAAHRWRVKRKNGGGGAFEGMIAMLLVNKDKHEQFERLIQAGGGLVVEAKPPYSSQKDKKVTHCFVSNKLDQPTDWAMLASKGILCFQPQYLNLQLTTNEPINPRDHVIQEFKKYLALVPQ